MHNSDAHIYIHIYIYTHLIIFYLFSVYCEGKIAEKEKEARNFCAKLPNAVSTYHMKKVKSFSISSKGKIPVRTL